MVNTLSKDCRPLDGGLIDSVIMGRQSYQDCALTN